MMDILDETVIAARVLRMDAFERNRHIPAGRYALVTEVEVTHEQRLIPLGIEGGKKIGGLFTLGLIALEPLPDVSDEDRREIDREIRDDRTRDAAGLE